MRRLLQWPGTMPPAGGPALICRDCHHYHTWRYTTQSGYCGEPMGGGGSCLCRSKERLSVDEADALGLGWP